MILRDGVKAGGMISARVILGLNTGPDGEKIDKAPMCEHIPSLRGEGVRYLKGRTAVASNVNR